MNHLATGETDRPGTVVPLSEPEIRGNEWAYVRECLDSGWVSSAGPFVDRFERELAACVGAEFAVATVNGTSALHTALLVAGVEQNDEVLVSSLTFIAPVNAIRYAGAWPVFIDAEPAYWQMNPERVIEFLENQCEWRDTALWNRASGRRIKAIVPVHILGHPVDMDPILAVARKFGLRVVEDATESLGAGYKDRRVGNLGDISCFSFNGNKIITCGGGGMIVTNDESWAARAKYLTTQAKDDPLEYVHNEVGYNYRLTNLQAAMGCAQLEQLSDFIVSKRRIQARYETALKDLPGITIMPHASWANSTFWLYTILVDQSTCGISSRDLLRRLGSAGIQTRPLWQPIHLSPAYSDCGSQPCPVSADLNRDALSLPSSVGLSNHDIDVISSRISGTLRDGI